MMINFKEYLTENRGNLRPFHIDTIKKFHRVTSLHLTPESKLVEIKSSKSDSNKIYNEANKLGDGVLVVTFVDKFNKDAIFTKSTGGWGGSGYGRPGEKVFESWKKEERKIEGIYHVAPDDEGLIKRLAKESPISKDMEKLNMSFNTFNLLFRQRLKHLISGLEKKYGVKYRFSKYHNHYRLHTDKLTSLPRLIDNVKSSYGDKISLGSAKDELNYFKDIERRYL